MKLIVKMTCGHKQTFKSDRITAILGLRMLNCRKCGCAKPVQSSEVRR